MKLKIWFYCHLILFGWAYPAMSAGVQLLDSDPNLEGVIWYPCVKQQQTLSLGQLSVQITNTMQGAKDCPVIGTKLPLVVFSHGTGGWFGVHHDTAEALANAGFIVASINHPGDNGNDRSQSDSLSNWTSRPNDIIRLIDFMLQSWKDREAIDPSKIGFFGFSKGGFTGLVLAGGGFDFERMARSCTNSSQFCEQLTSGDTPKNLPRETRIRAAIIADPAPSGPFTTSTLSAINIPLQVWRSETGARDRNVDPDGIARVLKSLPNQPTIHVAPSDHFAFHPPCSPESAAALPRFCNDPPGFDRAAFHRDFNASVIQFFRQNL